MHGQQNIKICNLNVVSWLSGLTKTMRYFHNLLGRSNRGHSDNNRSPFYIVTRLSHRTSHDWLLGPGSHLRQKDRTSNTQPRADVIRLCLQNCSFQRYVKSQSDLMLPVQRTGIHCMKLLQLEVWKQNCRNLSVEKLMATDLKCICFSRR